MSYNNPRIQNGHLFKAHRRNTYFSGRLYRVSELVQHPARITYREFCLLIWLLYALFRGFFGLRSVQDLVGHVDVTRLCGAGATFYRCSKMVAWKVFLIFWGWLGEVVPWAILCAAVVVLGEAVMFSK